MNILSSHELLWPAENSGNSNSCTFLFLSHAQCCTHSHTQPLLPRNTHTHTHTPPTQHPTHPHTPHHTHTPTHVPFPTQAQCLLPTLKHVAHDVHSCPSSTLHLPLSLSHTHTHSLSLSLSLT